VTALKRPQVRGAWGEMQLRNCVTAANMTEHVDFVSQVTVSGSDGGRLRPDLVVHLPADRDLVVDAKVPMDAYLRALDTTDETEQREVLRQHGRQTRHHIDGLASKRRGQGRAHRNPDDAHRAPSRHLLRVAPGDDRGVGEGDRRGGARAAQTDHSVSRALREARPPTELRGERLQPGHRLVGRSRAASAATSRGGRRWIGEARSSPCRRACGREVGSAFAPRSCRV
jgi:hypothetical protein